MPHLAFLLGLIATQAADARPIRVYVGTYTGGESRGIYVMELDPGTGKLSAPRLAAESVSPSFLAIHPDRKHVYAVSEIADFEGKKTGAVRAFEIESESGLLTPLNQQPSRGGGPCHLVVDHGGKNVLVANYGGGSVAVVPIGPDGKLGEPSSSIQHEGKGANPKRQEGPHAHSINLDAAGRFAVAADLGLDKLLVYRFDASKGTLTPNDPPSTSLDPGAGPRHFAFHPDGKHAYVINEMLLTVTALDYDADRGALTPTQTITTVPEGVTGDHLSTAEVQVHPSGKFLYGSNRGHHSIAAFSIDPKSGRLTSIGHQSTGGKTPRNFGIDPSGRYLLAANQDSGTVVVFAIDPKTGQLEPTGHSAEVPKPVCVKFLAPRGEP